MNAHRPPAARREEVVEILHGERIVDPYRWLEGAEDAEVRAWSEAQTGHTERLLRDRPGFEALAGAIERVLRIGAVEPPAVVGSSKGAGRYFHRRQRPADDQPILYVRDGVDGADRVVLDPNALSADGTASIDWWSPSPDGKLCAYGLSHGGDEESTLYVRDVETGRDLGDAEVIPRTRYASIAWLPDASGFFYSRYPTRGEVPDGEERYHRKIYEHRLGRPAALDPVVFGEGRAMTDTPGIDLSPNGRWLVASVHMGWSRREAYLRDREAGPDAPWLPLAVPAEDAVYDVLPYDDHLLVRTNEAAPSFRVYRVDPTRPARADWQLLVPESPHVLTGLAEIGGQIFASYIEDARSAVRRFGADGAPLGEVPLPTLGLVNFVHGEPDGHEAFLDFTSFAVPPLVLRLDLREPGPPSIWAKVDSPIDASQYVVEQHRVRSKDGTSIPIFVVHRKDLVKDGRAPTLLGGYGGFNISLLPQWSGPRYLFLERGGVSVTPNLRGGGELGEAWHRAGMLESKQNVFDDFIAVAQHLVHEGYTSPERLAIAGGSNGGLLVGAAITQRPELFRAAVCSVPLLDMLRYHRFLIAKLWVPEYGSAEDPLQFGWLRAYSPYHHVVPGTRYPAVLFCAAEGDSRVDPLHARKMAARMQAEAPSDDRPILLRIETKAGHGAGKPIRMRVDEQAAIYSFLFWQLGLEGGR